MRVLIVFVLALGLTGAAAADPAAPDAIRIEMDGLVTGPSTVEGTFSLGGARSDSGTYVETFRFAGATIHGEKRLVGDRGTLVLRVQGVVEWQTATQATFAAGHWQIVSGTGVYEGLSGGGSPLVVDGAADLATGTVHVVHVGRVH